MGEIGGELLRGGLSPVAGADLDAARAESLGAAAVDPRVGVGERVLDAPDPAGDQRLRAGGRAPVVRAGLERDVGGGAAREAAGLGERDDFRVIAPGRPTMRPSETRTAPTGGFGELQPRARSAAASASRIGAEGCSELPGVLALTRYAAGRRSPGLP